MVWDWTPDLEVFFHTPSEIFPAPFTSLDKLYFQPNLLIETVSKPY